MEVLATFIRKNSTTDVFLLEATSNIFPENFELSLIILL